MAGVVSVLSACGSGGSTVPSAGLDSAVTQARAADPARGRYLAAADQVCRAGNAAIAPVNAQGADIEQRHLDARRTAALLAPVLREGLRDYRRFYIRLRRVPPPARDRASVASIMAGLRTVGNDLERLTAALERGEFERVKTVTAERATDHARVSAQELEFGFKVCGQPQGRPSTLSG
jgi:hypothetical protein